MFDPAPRPSLRQRILDFLAEQPEGAADDDIKSALGVPHRAIVGGICAALERQGRVTRVHGVGSGKVTNRLGRNSPPSPRMAPPRAWRRLNPEAAQLVELDGARAAHAFAIKGSALIAIDEVSQALASVLALSGWSIETARESELEVVRQGERLIIELLGEQARPLAGEGFRTALGRLLEHMDSSETYAMALPASHQNIGLIQRLPPWVRKQLKLSFYLVKLGEDGGFEVGVLVPSQGAGRRA